MAEVRQICKLGHPVLRQIALPIYNIRDSWSKSLIQDLLATLHHYHGVGIAAPQIGISRRAMIVASHPNPRYPNAPKMEPTVMVNPHLIGHSDEQVKDWEGCLSIPGVRGLVSRYAAVEVEYTDQRGRLQRREFDGFVARIFQHEFDHLEGRVFLDHVKNTATDLISDQEYLDRQVRLLEKHPELATA